MAEEFEMEHGQTPEALQYAYMPEGREGLFATKFIEEWQEHYRKVELEPNKRNWMHFLNESEAINTKKESQRRTTKTTSTYYKPTISPAIITRTAVLMDAISQANPPITFRPINGADPSKVALQEEVVNYYLERDNFLVKMIERIMDQEIFPYGVAKCFPEVEYKNEAIYAEDGKVVTDSGMVVEVDLVKQIYAASTGQELPAEVLERYTKRNVSFGKNAVRSRPSHDNIPNGRFIYDSTQKNKKYWRGAGDIELVPFVWLKEREHQFDPKRIEKLEKLLRSQERGLSGYEDFYSQILEQGGSSLLYAGQVPQPVSEKKLLAKAELYIKVIEDKKVKIKKIDCILNLKEEASEKSGIEQVFLLKDPADSDYQLIDYPYVMSWTYKLPHSMKGMPTAGIGADSADMINELWNHSIDQARWSMFNMILMRKGVRIFNNFKVSPSAINELSDISENSIRAFNISQGNPGDIGAKLLQAEDMARNIMSAADVLQAVAPSGDEKLGTTKMRRESGVTKLNLTGLYVGTSLIEIGEMFRDLFAQLVANGSAVYINNQKKIVDAKMFTEESEVQMVNIMRLASMQEDLVRAKETYQTIMQNPIATNAVAQGDATLIWEATRRYLVALREKNVEALIGPKPEVIPPAPPPPQAGAVDPNAGQMPPAQPQPQPMPMEGM